LKEKKKKQWESQGAHGGGGGESKPKSRFHISSGNLNGEKRGSIGTNTYGGATTVEGREIQSKKPVQNKENFISIKTKE